MKYRKNCDKTLIILVHVDDLLILSKNLDIANEFYQNISSCFQEVKYSKESDVKELSYLGLSFSRDKENNIVLSSRKYINKFLEDNKIEGVRDVSYDNNLFIESENDDKHLLND